VVWRSLPDPAGYATPVLTEHRGRPLLVCWTPTNVRGLNPRTGLLLWTVPLRGDLRTAIATPICADGNCSGKRLLRGDEGDQARRLPTATTPAWQDKRNLRGLMSAPLHRAGYGYLLDKRHGLTCFELKTGTKVWDDAAARRPRAQPPGATLVWAGAGDRALILNSEGDLILARLSPAGYNELSRANIIGPTWAHPAYAGGCVLCPQ